MGKPDTSQYQTFDQISGRLDDIVGAVRSKDISLERSLDLFDEAIELGSRAVELVDATDFTPEEEARLADMGDGGDKDAAAAADDAATGTDAAAGDDAPAGDEEQ